MTAGTIGAAMAAIEGLIKIVNKISGEYKDLSDEELDVIQDARYKQNVLFSMYIEEIKKNREKDK